MKKKEVNFEEIIKLRLDDYLSWRLKWFNNFHVPRGKKSVLISGLPGIGDVGRISVEYLILKFKAKKIATISSPLMPSKVSITRKGIIKKPEVSLYAKYDKDKVIYFLTGDFQPSEGWPAYSFTDALLKIIKKLKCDLIITIGGVTSIINEDDRIFCFSNDYAILKNFRTSKMITEPETFMINNIYGVAGLLVGLAKDYGINALCLLVETKIEPPEPNIKGAHQIIKLINKKLSLNIPTKDLTKDFNDMKKKYIGKIESLMNFLNQEIEKEISDDSKPEKERDKIYIG